VAINAGLRKIVPRLSNLKETVFTPELMFETRGEANDMFNKYFR
jgi:hypothetical protein